MCILLQNTLVFTLLSISPLDMNLNIEEVHPLVLLLFLSFSFQRKKNLFGSSVAISSQYSKSGLYRF